MMWRLWHKLFGWDYIYWQNSADSGIARVVSAPDGSIWYYRYRNIGVIDQVPDPRLKHPLYIKPVIWLTCKPEKYFPNSTGDAA
jgi:hypothetical protein